MPPRTFLSLFLLFKETIVYWCVCLWLREVKREGKKKRKNGKKGEERERKEKEEKQRRKKENRRGGRKIEGGEQN